MPGGVSISPALEYGLLLCPFTLFALLLALAPPHTAFGNTTPTSRVAAAQAGATRTLRVCADPNNMPFSNERREGFENRIAALIASDMHTTLEYTWWAQRRGFVRNTLRAGLCDLLIGIPTTSELALVTRPYYRSTYVFVQRAGRARCIATFDDRALRSMRVGVQYIGDDYANTPPAHALTARGIVRNVTGFSIYGDYGTPNPPARIIDAVADGTLQCVVLGALLAMSRHPWYTSHLATSALWGLLPLADQQLAGLIMWIPTGLVYLGAMAAVVVPALSDASARRTHFRMDAPARTLGHEPRTVDGTVLRAHRE